MADAVRAVWEEILQYSPAEGNDDWFDMGGDSLSAVGLISRLRELDLTLSLAAFFGDPSLSGAIEHTGHLIAGHQSSVPSGALPLTPMQEIAIVTDLVNVNWHNDHFTLRLHESISSSAVQEIAVHLAVSFSSLTAKFLESSEGWIQFIAPLGQRAIRVVEARINSLDAIEEMTDLVQFEGRAFDITAGRIATLIAWEVESKIEALTLLFHHLSADGHSISVLQSAIDRILARGTFSDSRLAVDDYALWLEALRTLRGTSRGPTSRKASQKITRRNQNLVSRSFVIKVNDVVSEELSIWLVACFAKAHKVVSSAGDIDAKWAWMDVTIHGRDPVEGLPDLSSGVGWISCVRKIPLIFDPMLDDRAQARSALAGARANQAADTVNALRPAGDDIWSERPFIYLNYRGSMSGKLLSALTASTPLDLDFGGQSDPLLEQPYAVRCVVDRSGDEIRVALKIDQRDQEAVKLAEVFERILSEDFQEPEAENHLYAPHMQAGPFNVA